MTPDVARPLSQIGGRPQEHGRIRFGVKGPKGEPRALKTWRFTSPDREAIEQLAEMYGGKAKPWSDRKANPQDQFEVVTTSASINVMLPPDSLSVWYELWGGKGCLRRCDGETTQALTSNPNDPMVEVPCICNQNGKMECKPKSRLKVLLPEIRMAGFWRMETNSWNAVEELSAMEQALSTMQAYGILYARLTLHPQSTAGGSRKYVIPRLEFNESSQALIDGASTAVGLPTGTRLPATLGKGVALPAIGAGDDWIDQALEERPVADSNGEPIIEAEVVEDEPKDHHAKVRGRLHATIAEVANLYTLDTDDLRHGMVKAITQGFTESSTDLTDADVSRMISYLDEVLAGERTVQLRDGEVRLPKKES
jgi:hypothetical protein